MAQEQLTHESIVQKIDELPTLPTIVYELNKIISDPMSSTSDVENVMENDSSLTTRVLKLVNSAYYAIPGGVSNLSRAIAYLGFDTVQQLVLSATVIDCMPSEGDIKEFDIREFWKHSMGVAMAAETIAKKLDTPNHADLFTCGLLHDLGKMALFTLAPEEMVRISKHAIDNDLSVHDAEKELSSVRHTFIGCQLTRKWQLPTKIQLCAQFHHQYDIHLRTGVSAELNEIIDMVTLSNLLVHALKHGNSGHHQILPAPKSLLDRLGIDPKKMKDLVADIRESLTNAESFLEIIGGQ